MMTAVDKQLDALRAEHQFAEQDHDLKHRLAVVEIAAKIAQDNDFPIPVWAKFRVELIRNNYRDYLKKRFRDTNNPMYVCQAYAQARAIGDSPPGWVLKFLDQAMGEFWSRFVAFGLEKGPHNPVEAFCESFGIAKGGRSGRGTVWSRALADMVGGQWSTLGATVSAILSNWSMEGAASGEKESAAIEEALRRWNISHKPPVSRTTIWRAWKRYQRELASCCTCCPVHGEPTENFTKSATS